MNRKPPLRTYEKKKATNWYNPTVNSYNSDSPICPVKKPKKVEENDISGNSSYDDPFETTFDRIAKNARLLPPPATVSENSSSFSSTSSSYSICKDETNNSESSYKIPVTLSNSRTKPVRKKMCNKPQVIVMKGKIKRKDELTRSYNRKLRTRKKSASSEIPSMIKTKIIQKTYPSCTTRNQKKVKFTKNKQSKEFHHLSFDDSSFSSYNSYEKVSAKNRKKYINENLNVFMDEGKNQTSQITDAFKNLKLKPCFVVLNNVDVLKWKASVENNRNDIDRSSQFKETKSWKPAKNTICSETNSVSNNDAKCNNTSDLKCYSNRIELGSMLDIVPTVLRKNYENLVSSTPHSKPMRLLTHKIPLSPIPIRDYKEEDVLDACTGITTGGINTNDIDVLLLEETNMEPCKKSALEVEETHTSKYNVQQSSISLTIEHGEDNLESTQKLDSNSETASQVRSSSAEVAVDSPDISDRATSVNNISETWIEIKAASQDGTDLMKSYIKSAEGDTINMSDSILVHKDVKPDKEKKKERCILNFSMDSNKSESLFGDTMNITWTSVKRVDHENTKTTVSLNDLALESSSLCKTDDRGNNEFCTISIEDSSIQDLSTSNMVCGKTKKAFEMSVKNAELNSSFPKVEIHNKSKIGITDAKAVKLENSLKRTDKNCVITERCSVILTRLEDPIRVTKTRKRYPKWDLSLANICEDSSDVFSLEKDKLNSENDQQKRETKSHRRKPRLSQNTMGPPINSDTRASTLTRKSIVSEIEKPVYLKPGKSWARSLSILSNVQNESNLDQLCLGKGKKWRNSVQDILNMQKQGVVQSCIKRNTYDKELLSSTELNNKDEHVSNNKRGSKFDSASLGRFSKRVSVRVVRNTESVRCIEDAPFLEAYGIVPLQSQSLTLIYPRLPSVCNVQNDDVDSLSSDNHTVITPKDVVLQRCVQKDYMPFSKYFTDSYLKHCRKIGEGVYGEVFLYEKGDKRSVVKIIPIEGSEQVNGEPQKKFHEILSEIVIAMELHNLRLNTKYNTDGFVEVQNIKCIMGKYPEKLVELWNIYDEEKTSDNDCPAMFGENQLYITLELGHGGQDLEAFVFHTAEEAHALFIQAALALAVAERAVEFEHRDLHWGNILISRTNEPFVYYTLDDKEIKLPSRGVKVSIIDFTLSRMSYQGCSIFNDLASDPALFTAQGEYQFEIYRLMRDKIENNWHQFEPFTNILWLHYTLDKMITAVRYKKRIMKIHKNAIMKLVELKNEVLTYNSSFDFVIGCDKITSMLDITSK